MYTVLLLQIETVNRTVFEFAVAIFNCDRHFCPKVCKQNFDAALYNTKESHKLPTDCSIPLHMASQENLCGLLSLFLSCCQP
mgnify:CR=1 FL=1